MVYEGRRREEVSAVKAWCEKVGLPTSLKALGSPSKAALRKAADYAAAKDPDSRNMPERMRPQDILKAMEAVEAL